jgi:hypothetical protein
LGRRVSSSVPFRTVPFRSVPFRSVPFRSVPFRSVPFRSVPFRSVPFPYMAAPSRKFAPGAFHTEFLLPTFAIKMTLFFFWITQNFVTIQTSWNTND